MEVLEIHAPLNLQESYDNAGLIIGNPEMELSGAIVTVGPPGDCPVNDRDEKLEGQAHRGPGQADPRPPAPATLWDGL